MQKKQNKKLALNRLTIKSLNDEALNAIAGGCDGSNTCYSMCRCPTECCGGTVDILA